MEKIDYWWTLILFTMVSITMTLIFISTIVLYYRRKQRVESEKLDLIERSEKKYRTLVQSMDDIVVVVNRKSEILFHNDHLSLLSKSTKSYIGQSLTNIFPSGILVELEKLIDTVFDSGKTRNLELEIFDNSRNKWYDITINPQIDKDNRVHSVLCILHDFTNRKNLEIELNEAIAALNNQKGLLENLSSEVIHAQEEERKRISRDLHDEIGQILTAVSFNIEYLNQASLDCSDEIAEKLNGIKSLIKKSIKSVHEFSHDLRPSVLDALGFVSAIRSQARNFRELTDINVKFKKIDVSHEIDDNKQIVLYRIFQEGLNNIAKHSQAKNVQIELFTNKNSITMVVSDDGLGFNINELDEKYSGKGGLGLKGMKERIKLIGGKLNLVSKPKQGTTIFVETPIN